MSLLDLTQKNVLIVDDVQDIRSMIRGMIEPLSPKSLRVAKNGEEAIEKMEEVSFDIVLCDYNLGRGKDGQQVLEEAKVRNLLAHSSIFVMVTAESQSMMVMAAIDYLPDAYLTKPVNRSLLHTRLQRVIAKKEGMAHITKAMLKKDYDLALKLCNEELFKNPRNSLSFLKTKGELLSVLGEYDQAAELYELLLEEHPVPWAKLELGRIRYLQGKLKEAEETLNAAIKDNPSNASCYDWLAKTLEKKGDLSGAQESLTKAIDISPKSVVRQRHLGEIANKNGDFDASESAYKQTLEHGQHSCYRDADDYTRLVSTLIKKEDTQQASNVLTRLTKEFDKENMSAKFQSAVAEALVCKATNDNEGLKAASQKAISIASENPKTLSVESSLELTNICLENGDQEAAEQLAKQLILNNHDNNELHKRMSDVYAEAGLEDVGTALVENARKEVVKINNDGTKLLREGKLEEAMGLLMKANQAMPENTVVLVNLIFTLIKQMEKTGMVKKYQPLTMEYLNRLNSAKPNHPKYPLLLKMIHKIPEEKVVANA